eukprot:CAMPEP_0185430076 /NCGR_PEP_ID=MMETSP1365-20130426/17188_1 /TAXON_ID=38817 /ORGANISM="Gephyrocapsa oceanica, Strain RCC1303" /LENGTH=537 /DNA_ID=CAMNT_0028034333 /DNA_START=54 /DNA_END=1668 /DNA_ORIENTATION=+
MCKPRLRTLLTGSSLRQEVRAQLCISLPVAFSAVLRRTMTVVTVAFVGRLGKQALAAAALAQSTTNTVALSVFVGLSSASVTLVSQAVGAREERWAALWLHHAVVVHCLAAVPLTLLLLFFGPLMRAVGEDGELSALAGKYAQLLLPGLWGWALLWALQPWLQCHGVVRVQTLTAGLTAALHPCLLALLTRRLGLRGAALAESISNCVSFLLLLLAAGCTPLRRALPWARPSRASVARLLDFLRLGLPGVCGDGGERWGGGGCASQLSLSAGVVMMLEWWASEICILVSGLLPAPALALSSLSIVQSVNAVAFMLPLGASVAGATRVGAALGRADHEGARCAAATCGSLGVCFGATTGLLLLLLRRGVGGLFTQDEEVVSLVGTLLLPLSVYVLADATQVCCSGVLQGCGRQRLGMPVVLACYYAVGLPLGGALAFTAGWGARGMVLGMCAGKLLHAAALVVLVSRTDWRREVREAAARLQGEGEDRPVELAPAPGVDEDGGREGGGAAETQEGREAESGRAALIGRAPPDRESAKV